MAIRSFRIMNRKERKKGVRSHLMRKGSALSVDSMSGFEFSCFVKYPWNRWYKVDGNRFLDGIPF